MQCMHFLAPNSHFGARKRVKSASLRPFSRLNGLIGCCFALFVTRLPVHIGTGKSVIVNIPACAFNDTHGAPKLRAES